MDLWFGPVHQILYSEHWTLAHQSFPKFAEALAQAHSFPSELLTLSATLPKWRQTVTQQFLLNLNIFSAVLTQTAEHNLQGHEG